MTATENENDVNKNLQEKSNQPLSVTEACRIHSGYETVRGVISSISELYKMASKVKLKCPICAFSKEKEFNHPICLSAFNRERQVCPVDKCEGQLEREPTYVNAVTIELRNPETFNDLDKMKVILCDDNSYDIGVGENALITGNIDIGSSSNFKKGRGSEVSILYANKIEYENREQLSLTSADIHEMEQFRAKFDDSIIIKELVSLFANNVIGLENVKKGILLSAANTKEDEPNKRKRIHVLLAGPPGLAKTSMLAAATNLVQGSSVEVAQSSTGLSLTAMVVREDDMYMLRMGPVPRNRGKFCGIDEINRMSFQDQAQLLNYMQHGQSTLNKYGIHAEIRGPTTIIASANPSNPYSWVMSSGKVDLGQLNIIAPLLDRFDLRFIIKKPKGAVAIREYATKKAELEGKEIADDSLFLRKWIEYSKTFDPELTDDAKFILVEYHTNAAVAAENDETNNPNGKFESLRVLESLFNIARAIARLKFKKVVDIDDAKEAIEFLDSINKDYRESVAIPRDPRYLTASLILVSLQELATSSTNSNGVSVNELCRIVCQRNPQVSNYLGNKWSMDANKKVKNVMDVVRVNKNVQTINLNPLLLRWNECEKVPPDLFDPYDARNTESVRKNKNVETQNVDDQTHCNSAKSNGSNGSDIEKSIGQELFGKPPERPRGFLS